MLGVTLEILWLLILLPFSLLETLFRSTVLPRHHKSIKGELALVTGAGHGIGKEYALQLGRLGAKVVCWDINAKTCAETRKEIEAEGGTAWDFVCDVSDREAIARVAEKTRSVAGRVTILVNNAGVMTTRPFLCLKPEEVKRDYEINVFSQYYMLMEFLPSMYERDHGHVLAMSSSAGTCGGAFCAIYCATKFANRGMMDSLFLEQRQEMPNSKVKMTTVLPFIVNTGLTYKPHSRFSWLVPIVEPQDCAQQAIGAMLRDEEDVFVPSWIRLPLLGARSFPRRFQLALLDFMDVFVGYRPEE